MEYPEFKVCVRCFTFNQSQYIKDALNGFVMQQTDFPFVCCIVDDASTDGEQKVIRKYVSDNFDLSEGSCHFERETDYAFITYAQHKTNKNCYFAVLYLKENHYSINKPKMPYLSEWLNNCIYEALCEGDDWWIDDCKLQKQYNILESHPNIDMCCCGTICYKDGVEIGRMQPSMTDSILTTEQAILGGGEFVGTNSIFKRMSLTLNRTNFVQTYPIDYFAQIEGSLRGGIYYLSEFMAAYRVGSVGSWTTRMAQDNFKRFNHCARVIYTYSILDNETEYKFHDIIKKEQLIEVLGMLLVVSNLSEFRKVLFQYNWKKKVKLLCNLIKPW